MAGGGGDWSLGGGCSDRRSGVGGQVGRSAGGGDRLVASQRFSAEIVGVFFGSIDGEKLSKAIPVNDTKLEMGVELD
ncbi:hypothetical protein Q3G72_012698 [Acer saccharum]|nr:hypothetical protein Q3G72_012698 [Acer saccharum]